MFSMLVDANGRSIKTVTHDRPHIDEAFAIWALSRCADEEFLDKFAKDGIIEFGCGMGPFDEHVPNRSSECCATLLMGALGVRFSQEYSFLLKYILRDDTKGSGDRNNIGAVMKRMYFIHSEEPEFVVRWAIIGIDAKYRNSPRSGDFRCEAVKEAIAAVYGREQSEEWYDEVVKSNEAGKKKSDEAFEICNSSRLFRITLVRKIGLWVSVLETDNEICHSILLGRGSGVVIQRNTSRNVQIFSNTRLFARLRISMREAAAILGIAEQVKRGIFGNCGKPKIMDLSLLRGPGNPTGYWFYYPEMEAIFNGSLTYPKIPPTELSLGIIFQAVKHGIIKNFEYANLRRIRARLLTDDEMRKIVVLK